MDSFLQTINKISKQQLIPQKKVSPPLQKNSDNKRISSPQTVQKIAQKFIQEVVDTIQTNQYNPDPVIEQCFKWL